ncbi:Serine/threonine-protein kinase ksp1 [Phlyctema vagabunda]|uniref:Serine/threonine-protein kinase ksp1 n=1 Tax=Phlyctema vagabunda TaxID=108571 RepID=A0ABR4PUI7_9HELO
MECMKDTFYDGVVLDGRFETISPLNHGSFGMVFMAKDLTTNDLVAIKCLIKKSAIDESDPASAFAVDERSEELACHARLGSHANIVNLIHSFETEAHIYIVLEFCSQGDLYEAIRTGTGPLETEHVRQFMLQLVDAVIYIHSKGMAHRDIKPENIFLTQDGEMKLGDFGLASSEDWTYETNVGSDRYMAPEQYDSDGNGYAPKETDIWAIGICLLNILFSRNPFITPTESDPLFLDFSRDKQSLFDVFPNMSQDTYEVIAQCMSLDPSKRSLQGAREALERVVSFTTDDESLDDFCASERPVMASANREPLRTPSIQSPQIDQGSFPWAKALHTSPPQTFRQLSNITDESYTEDLFPSSEESNKDWFSVGEQTPSMASFMGASSFGTSFKSMAIRRPTKAGPPRASLTPISGSLPIAMSRPKPLPSMASVFGKKQDGLAKSWSDLWEEDEEEEEAEKQLKARQMNNARTWSHESTAEEAEATRKGLSEPKGLSFVNVAKLNTEAGTTSVNDIDEDLVADGFFFHGPKSVETKQPTSPRYSPPSKRTTFDKWAVLGQRRRAYTGQSESEKSPDLFKGRRNVGLGFAGFGASVWDSKANTVKDTAGKGCPWAKDIKVKARDQENRKGKDLGDLEWVGGWQAFHL